MGRYLPSAYTACMIHFEHVSKHYGPVVALADLSLDLDGGITGLLGPNGAGKSTALKLVTGYLGPSAGTIRVLGGDPCQVSTRSQIGYLPEGAPLLPEATVDEVLRFSARVRLRHRTARRAAMEALFDRLDLGRIRHRDAVTLSKGQRRRVALAAAVIGNPTVLVLDEPTDGLDPNQRDEVHALIRELATERTVLLSTHLLDEAERLCDRAVIIAAGRLLADDTPMALARRSRHHDAVRIACASTADAFAIAETVRQVPDVLAVEMEDHGRTVTALARPGHRPFARIATTAAKEGWPIDTLHVESGRLDDVFRSLTQQEPSA
jgi:ABC-2 type transport system ATP-binding protein